MTGTGGADQRRWSVVPTSWPGPARRARTLARLLAPPIVVASSPGATGPARRRRRVPRRGI